MNCHGHRPFRHPEFYQSLATESIRVFELEAGNFSDTVIGRLVPQAIDGEPYEALSYVWGDRQKRRDIVIDGTKFSVTANLHGALTAFRNRPWFRRRNRSSCDNSGPGTRPAPRLIRRLWTDAICINQEDLSERTSQVGLMARIFAGARRVLAWIGWEKEGEIGHRPLLTAMRFIHDFMQDPEAGMRDARVLLHHHGDMADIAEHLATLSEYDRRQFEEQAVKWKAVKVFFEIQYFHRTWIVQELGLARKAIMCTALKPAVRNTANATTSCKEKAAASKGSPTLEMDLVDWQLVGRFVKFLDYSGATLTTHLGLLTWVAHHILMVWEVKQDGTPNSDFLTAMHWTRILGVMDARDRVYSLLGHPLAIMDGQPVIKPDYTVTRGVTYTKLAAHFIRKTNNLYIVNLVDHEDDPSKEGPQNWDPYNDGRMPSWVPDWHSINRTTPLEYPIAAASDSDTLIQIIGETDGTAGTPMPHLLLHGWVVDEIAAVSRRMETTDFPITNLTRECAKTNPFWLDRLWELAFPPTKCCSANHNALEVLETLSLALPLGTKNEDGLVSTAGSHQTLKEHRRSFAAYVLEYHKLCYSGCIDNDNNHDRKLRPARSLYDSLPTDAQAELRRRAEGGATGERFVECMTWPAMCRVVYRTASGLVGMGSRVLRPGDLVCRVRGSPVLMTLRRIQDNCCSSAGRETQTETGASSNIALISCAYIGPTVVPARVRKGVLDGGVFGEKAVQFRIM